MFDADQDRHPGRLLAAYCLRDTGVVTVEQLLNVHSDVVAITELEKAPCPTPGCIGPRVKPR
jgi:hypothetical protein